MRRSRVAIALAVPAVALASSATVLLVTRESSEPASVTAALARFRALPPSARMAPERLRGRTPRPGVYVYATNGFEVSHVLGTRRHRYPARTTITVTTTPRGCVRTRWDVLRTRRDATLACLRTGDGAPRLIDQAEAHAFAGHLDRRAYRCTRDSSAGPVRLAPGATWRSRCAIAGTTTVDDGTVLGPRTLTRGGERTRTVLLRTRTRVRGDTVGAGTTFTWVLPDTRLVVRRTIAHANTTDTIVGAVRYEEHVTLTLATARRAGG